MIPLKSLVWRNLGLNPRSPRPWLSYQGFKEKKKKKKKKKKVFPIYPSLERLVRFISFPRVLAMCIYTQIKGRRIYLVLSNICSKSVLTSFFHILFEDYNTADEGEQILHFNFNPKARKYYLTNAPKCWNVARSQWISWIGITLSGWLRHWTNPTLTPFKWGGRPTKIELIFVRWFKKRFECVIFF